MDRILQALAVVLAAAAGYLLWIGSKDYAFVTIVLACVAFFVAIRFQAKARIKARKENDTEHSSSL